jgi:hypothetical protein
MSIPLAAWDTVEVLGLAGIVTAGIVVVNLIEAYVRLRRLRAETDLKRQMLERGLSVEEVARMFHPPVQPIKLARRLGEYLVRIDAGPEEVEQVLAAFAAADAPTKQLLVKVVEGIVAEQVENGNTDPGRVLGAVRGLSGRSRVEVRDVPNVLPSESPRGSP